MAKTTRSKLIKKLDTNFSIICRTRDMMCLCDGKPVADIKELDCHHWIHGRKNIKYRWDLRNLVSLKKGNHMFKIHLLTPRS